MFRECGRRRAGCRDEVQRLAVLFCLCKRVSAEREGKTDWATAEGRPPVVTRRPKIELMLSPRPLSQPGECMRA